MAGSSTAVRTEGLRELQVALRELYPELYAELKVGLNEITDKIASDAVNWAAAQGFEPPGLSGRGSGALIGSIRGGTTNLKGYVTATAERNGYFYPARYEYESSGTRAFLHPAIEHNEAMIYESIVAIVDHVHAKFAAAGV